jgi:hypothetical protein
MEQNKSLKKSGGQPGNKNAYKHGFYSRHFNRFENRVLSRIPITDLSGEIGLLRINIDRFMQAYTASLEDMDYADRLSGLRAITLAVARLSALQRTQSIAGKHLAEDEKIIEAIHKLPDYPDFPDDDQPSGTDHPQV